MVAEEASTERSGVKILVLLGGDSAEREVSLASGEAVVKALQKQGHQVIAADPAVGLKRLSDTNSILLGRIKKEPPAPEKLPVATEKTVIQTVESFDFEESDVIFLALHGGKGEDGTLQALLDMTGKPYTGSGMLASALAMNKAVSKRLFVQARIPTPHWLLCDTKRSRNLDQIVEEIRAGFAFPLVVKPHNQGSTVGLSVVHAPSELKPALETAAKFSPEVIVEEFIAGREITVGILGERALPVVEIIPQHEVYDYECKYTKGRSDYVCPAELTKEEAEEVQNLGLRAFQCLGCSGYGRVDFRMSREGKFYCLEVNTLPGMTALSLVPMAAKGAGLDFPHLLEAIIEQALMYKKSGAAVVRS